MPEKLDSNSIVRYSIEWSDNEGINKDDHSKYIDEFSETFYVRIVDLVEKALAKQRILPHNKYLNFYICIIFDHLNLSLSRNLIFKEFMQKCCNIYIFVNQQQSYFKVEMKYLNELNLICLTKKETNHLY